MKRRSYIISIVGLAMLILLLATNLIYAWYTNYHRQEIGTGTEVITPYTFYVGAGNRDNIQNLDMGNLDIHNGTSATFVFCVVGMPANPYYIQLAYTTNIQFSYQVYKASLCNFSKLGGTYTSFDDVVYPTTAMNADTTYTFDASYSNSNGNTFYFSKDDEINLNTLNAGSNGVANGSYKEESYGSYSNVQANALAIYKKSGELTISESEGQKDKFEHYYILQISWSNDLENKKEVDQVYLTVSLK